MKKRAVATIALALVVLLVIPGVAFGQAHYGHKATTSTLCNKAAQCAVNYLQRGQRLFIDLDGDGICDNRSAATKSLQNQNAPDANAANTPEATNAPDANAANPPSTPEATNPPNPETYKDNRGDGPWCGNCLGYTDYNGDGVCDNNCANSGYHHQDKHHDGNWQGHNNGFDSGSRHGKNHGRR